MYKFRAAPIKIVMVFLTKINNSKSHSQIYLEKEEQSWRLHSSWFQNIPQK